MEKLILRSIMWGADKIPDEWFEKVPGGYYKAKDAKLAKEAMKDADRPYTSGSGSGRSRHHGKGDSRRKPPPEAYYDDDDDNDDERKRFEDRRRHRHRDKHRESYDGMDENYYYSGDDDRRPPPPRSARRRRSFDDRERSEYREDGAKPHRKDRAEARPVNGNRASPSSGHPAQPHPDQYAPPVAAAATAAGVVAAGNAPYPHSTVASPQAKNPQPPDARGPAPVAGGYVPYAHIYGPPVPPAANVPLSTAAAAGVAAPPPSATASAQPSTANPAVHPVAPQPYHQNPHAQDFGAGPDSAANPSYAAQSAGSQNGYDPSRYRIREDDRYGYHGQRRARSERRRREEEYMQGSESQGGRDRGKYVPKGYETGSYGDSTSLGSTAGGSVKTVDPRRPLNAQLRPDGEPAGARRRKNERYEDRYANDDDSDHGRSHRRNGRHRSSGYYSD